MSSQLLQRISAIAPLLSCAAMAMAMFYAGRAVSINEPGTRTYGPIDCASCVMPWPSLQDARDTENILNQEAISNQLSPGDKVIVCNQESCVTYQLTSEGRWNGIEERRQDSGRGSSGTGTPAGGGSGGAPRDPRWGNIDCWTCTGTVTVGPIGKN